MMISSLRLLYSYSNNPKHRGEKGWGPRKRERVADRVWGWLLIACGEMKTRKT